MAFESALVVFALCGGGAVVGAYAALVNVDTLGAAVVNLEAFVTHTCISGHIVHADAVLACIRYDSAIIDHFPVSVISDSGWA